ncbi:ATP-binding protein of ABC transporter [Planktothrix sp. PCC 11201]|uniref:ABC transporter ATP-binding protein n=1 Tax=Planktothrix sp. PCC 11201 TaxID=1729650 RepID=UPI000910FC8B|nr:ABC transporter ATP-binding protein [Planktothrix sp. PCC 11201]SKB14658.1 ATP-binding protein of ABC transporter [Planktothrix sp. PCC 11201]
MSATRFLFQYAKRYPVKMILTVVLGFSGAIFSGVGTTLIVPVILNLLGQSIELQSAPPIIQKLLSPFGNIPESYRLGLMTGAIIFTLVLKNLTTYLNTLIAASLSRRLTCDIREAGIQLLLDIDIDFYSKTKVGDLINRLGEETRRTSSAISLYIGLFTTGITVFTFLTLLVSISWQLTLATTLVLAVVTGINQSIISRSKKYGSALSKSSRNYSVQLMEILNGMRQVKAMGHEQAEYESLKILSQKREKAEFQSLMNSSAIAPINEVVNMIVILLLVVLGRRFLASEEIQSLTTILLTYLFLLFRTLPLISTLNNLRSNLAQNMPSVLIIQEFLRRDNKPFMNNGSLPYPGLQQEIHFDHLSFGYPGNDKLVLKDIDLHLPRGTTLALVGGSGAGKSTLADLLTRFFDPVAGAIKIDDHDLREFDFKSLRRAMGIVSQDTFLFNTSVRNNIAYAKPNATDEEIFNAAKRANAYEFIITLPQGFDTQIGDRGVLLSGGQRQRLSIARALLQNPEILILDEATSALDTVSERLVQEAIDQLSHNRTTLVIAHRLSTIQKAHQIAVLDQGQVVEVGTHNELLAKGGQYAKLYSLQFADEVSRDAALIKSSYEVRSRLNPMIGFLRLLLDEMVDTPEEKEELIMESYKSATSILENLEFIEKCVKLRLKNY